ncbi:MAG: outer membrane chaperone Skp [Rhodobacter sp.]|nr:outer membrane chaperone Skp [Rhodobacter sp.]
MMRVGVHLTRAFSGLRFLVVAICLAGPALAQADATTGAGTDATVPGPVILTLDQDRLFAESAFGKASLAREAAATRALEAENAEIEAELIAEEQDLTTRRQTLPSNEFAALAAAFDAKVEQIRDAQDAKARDLTRARDEDRKVFLRAVVPVLGELMSEKGAVAILDKSTVILSLTSIDLTSDAILRIDAVLSEGTTLPEAPQGTP